MKRVELGAEIEWEREPAPWESELCQRNTRGAESIRSFPPLLANRDDFRVLGKKERVLLDPKPWKQRVSEFNRPRQFLLETVDTLTETFFLPKTAGK